LLRLLAILSRSAMSQIYTERYFGVDCVSANNRDYSGAFNMNGKISWQVKLTNYNQVQITADEIVFKNGFLCTRLGNKWFEVYPVNKILGKPKILKSKR